MSVHNDVSGSTHHDDDPSLIYKSENESPNAATNSESLSRLSAALLGKDPDAAVAAANALGSIGPEAVDSLLAVFMPDSKISDQWIDWGRSFQTIRSAAARALGKIGDRRALDSLAGAIGTYDEWTSEAAIFAVVALGGDPRAVVPILQANLPTQKSNMDWYYWDRIKAAGQMGPQTFEALIDATKNSDDAVRSLALRALMEITATKDASASQDVEATEQWERASWQAVVCSDDSSASVRLSAIELLCHLDIPGKGGFLVTLLDDTSDDEHSIYYNGDIRTVGQAAANDLPDDDATLESLRRELADGWLDAALAWEAFVDRNGNTEQVRGSVRHGAVIVPYILEVAKRGYEGVQSDEFNRVMRALGWVATARVLERLGQNYVDDASEIFDARDALEYAPELFGRIPLRWLYRVGDEFRDESGNLWKIVRRIPDADAWLTLVFDITNSSIKSVSRGVNHSWWNMSAVAALIPIEAGTFDSVLQGWEAERALERKTAALKARHGIAPRSALFAENPKVQEFAAAVGIPTADVQKHLRERQGKLLGSVDRIEPNTLESLCDDYNIIPAVTDAVN